MCEKLPDEPRNALEKIKRTLFNIDLELIDVDSRLKLCEAKMQQFRDSKKRLASKQYISAAIDEKKLTIYRARLIETKNEIYAAIEPLLKTYRPKYREIWVLHFIQGHPIEEIAIVTKYADRHVKRIIASMRRDLIAYVGKDEEN